MKQESFYRFYLNQLAVFDRPGHRRDGSYQQECSRSNHIKKFALFVIQTSSWSFSTANPLKCCQTNWSLGKIKIDQFLANETAERRKSGAIKTQVSWGVVMGGNYSIQDEPCEPLWFWYTAGLHLPALMRVLLKHLLLITSYPYLTMKSESEPLKKSKMTQASTEAWCDQSQLVLK